MPTKRCHICKKPQLIEETSISCSRCEERELDLLMKVYAYIHLSGNAYCSAIDILKEVEAINHLSVDRTFLNSWIMRQWLEKNELDSLKVPDEINEELDQHGFVIGKSLKNLLDKKKKSRPHYDLDSLKQFNRTADEDKDQKRNRMAYVEKNLPSDH